jgi:signal peptidase I
MTSFRRGRPGAVAGIAIGLFALVALFALWPTQLGGYTSYMVTHGISMEPRFHTGDLAILRQVSKYQVGEIVAYHSRALNIVVMHRIVAIHEGLYIFKGDNNSGVDLGPATRSELIGKLLVRVPHGGIFLKWAANPVVIAVAVLGVLATGGKSATTRRRSGSRKVKGKGLSKHFTTAPSPAKKGRLTTAPPGLRMALSVTAVAGALGLALGALGWTGPTTKVTTTQAPLASSTTFAYTASVPQTAAYPGTTVTSPEPIFRKLVSTVDVHVAYRGSPGTLGVVADLSSTSGWQSTVQLAAPRRFTTDRYDASVVLDLPALDAQEAAASTAIGIPQYGLTVDVVAQVTTAGGWRLTPTLSFSLTPLELTLSGDAATLVVVSSTSSTVATTGPRTISALGRHMTAGTARSLSVVLLLGALLTGAVLGLLVRRLAPASEGIGILRRYASLLVAVHPMPAPQGRQVVDVTTFATLAQLAERYGLLVLHWSRNGVETFIVQDQGATYRYRAGPGEASGPMAEEALTGDLSVDDAIGLHSRGRDPGIYRS